MMVVLYTMLRNQSPSQKGQSLPFPLVAGRSNGCLFMVQQPGFTLVLLDLRCQCFVQITYLTRWKEALLYKEALYYIILIPELVHYPSRCALFCLSLIRLVNVHVEASSVLSVLNKLTCHTIFNPTWSSCHIKYANFFSLITKIWNLSLS